MVDGRAARTHDSWTAADQRNLDRASLDRAKALAGRATSPTSRPASCPRPVILLPRPVARRASFRMSKTDLRARPMFHRTRDWPSSAPASCSSPWSGARTVQPAPDWPHATSSANCVRSLSNHHHQRRRPTFPPATPPLPHPPSPPPNPRSPVSSSATGWDAAHPCSSHWPSALFCCSSSWSSAECRQVPYTSGELQALRI